MATRLGIDIGGSGIKGAPVDVATGELLAPRLRFETPQPATPAAIATVVKDIARHFDWTGTIGAAFPAVVKRGTVLTATNIDQAWVGCDAAQVFSNACGGVPVTVLNDADAAGIGEMRFGAGKGRRDVVAMVTLGTGIGFSVFFENELVPNMQLGQISIRGKPAEQRAAESARERKGLSWKQWAKRLNEYFDHLEALTWPDLIILGGGISKKSDKFVPLLRTRAELVSAALLNNSGIVGAALAASD
jgi:polyphosphate glucokinase